MAFCFMGLLLPLIPFFNWATAKQKRHKHIFTLFKIWSNWFFVLIGMPIRRIMPNPAVRDLAGPVIICANHTSYMDIPVITRTNWLYHKYIGKSELAKIPVFGPVFRDASITVNRKDPSDRKLAIQKMSQEVDRGASIAIFPEGSINKTPPALKPFRDGAFQVAIEKQIPILPVTILDNWRILPGDSKEMRNKTARVIYHDPISTRGMGLTDVKALKDQVCKTIEKPLRDYFPEEFKALDT